MRPIRRRVGVSISDGHVFGRSTGTIPESRIVSASSRKTPTTDRSTSRDGGTPRSCPVWANACSTRSVTGRALALSSSCPRSSGSSRFPCSTSSRSSIPDASWALGLLVLPIFMPMTFGLRMVLGYHLLYLGHMFVASSMGENGSPRWPEWNPSDISEGIGRWLWAAIFGIALGRFPSSCTGSIADNRLDQSDHFHRADSGFRGCIHAHRPRRRLASRTSSRPTPSCIPSIFRVGWDFVFPSLVASVAIGLAEPGSGPLAIDCRRCGSKRSRCGPTGCSSSTRRWSSSG